MGILIRYRNLILTTFIIFAFVALTQRNLSAPTLVSILLSGITLAALYFLVASGLSLIFGLMDVLNFAHGSLFMLGAYAGWTFYTNPRLIFNTAPLALAFASGAMVTTLRAYSLPRAGRAFAGLGALALVFLAVRDFPLDKLVAQGTTMVGRVVATAQAQEPIEAMLARIGIALAAGFVAQFALGFAGRAESASARGAASAIALVLIALVVLFARDAGEQFILKMESSVRFAFALGAGAASGALLGALMEWGLIRPLYSRPIYQILLTLGLVFVFDQSVRLIWGPAGAFMEIPSLFTSASNNCPTSDVFVWLTEHCDSILILGRAFPSYRLFIIAVGVLMTIALAILLTRSRLGMIIRAGVQDSEMVEALGINVRRVFTLVFAIGAALAGLGGVAAAPFLGVYPGMGLEFLLQAAIVVVIGGMGSIPGAAVGALLVGLARAYGDNIVLSGIQLPWMPSAISGSPAIARASTVLIMAIVLFIKPTGIFGKKE